MRSVARFLVVLLLLAGCSQGTDMSSDAGTDAAAQLCQPGSIVPCPCLDGSMASQVCGVEGTYGFCLCSQPAFDAGDDGGDAGDAGGPTGPVLLASSQQAPRDLVVDGSNVYWTAAASETIARCNLEGCSQAPTVLATTATLPFGVAVSAGVVFWTTNGTALDGGLDGAVLYTPSSTSNAMPKTLSPGQIGADAIAADPNNVYWSATGALRQCDLLTCPAPKTLANETARGIAVDATRVYWVTDEDDAAVRSCTIDGCMGLPTSIATGQGKLRGIAVDGANVYWASASVVSSCPRAGCPASGPVVLAQNQNIVALRHPLASDGTHVYWGDGKTIARCSVDGCGGTPTVVAPDQIGPTAIAVDATRIYWIDGDSIKTMIKSMP